MCPHVIHRLSYLLLNNSKWKNKWELKCELQINRTLAFLISAPEKNIEKSGFATSRFPERYLVGFFGQANPTPLVLAFEDQPRPLLGHQWSQIRGQQSGFGLVSFYQIQWCKTYSLLKVNLFVRFCFSSHWHVYFRGEL